MHYKSRAVLLMLVLLGVEGVGNLAAADRPPNVVLIMADDVSWECFSCYGAQDYHTPNIDALAANGIRFNNCFSTPLCTPSRVKLMTGQYNFRNYTHFGYLNPNDKTFGHLMQSAGYKTAIAGKWQLNGLSHNAEDSSSNMRPLRAGFDEYCLWQLTTVKGGRGEQRGGERFWSPPLECNGRFLSKQDHHQQYGPDIMSDFICDFIDRHQSEPFFVYYPTVLVHDPFVPTPDSIGDRARTHDMNVAPKDAAQQKENFVAMVHYLDKIVGKVVKKIGDVGQLDNTIILFTADNGTNTRITSTWQGREIQGGKGGTKDMGTHVPLVASWPGHTPAGSVLDDVIDFTDFYPTIAAAAGIQLGDKDPIDGKSFFAQLSGQPGNSRDWVFWHYQPYWGNLKGNQFARDANYKLYRDGNFYHVPSDLNEQRPLDPGQADSAGEASRKKLSAVLDSAPPAPPAAGGKEAAERPTYPDWRALTAAHDPAVEGEESAITVPTPDDVVAKMLELVQLRNEDLVYDLGCGDGRIVVTASAQYGCHAVGFDINPLKIRQARQRVKQHGVEALVRIEQQDIFRVDLTPASVITLYLLPEMNDQLVPQLKQMKEGARIVCHDFPIEAYQHDQQVTIKSKEDGAPHEVYVYRLPLKLKAEESDR